MCSCLQAFDNFGNPILRNKDDSVLSSAIFEVLSTIELIFLRGGGEEVVFDCFLDRELGGFVTILLSGMWVK